MPKKLVIVESPAKARTIAGFLGDGFIVDSSVGHIRDLPRSAADVPKSMKDEPWARLGVDVDNDFKPLYVVPTEKKKVVARLRKLLKEADAIYLATDEDREGESIAWHLLEVLNAKLPVHRMVFHEITPAAIQAAIDNPRDVDRRLVDAQEARRILDRLYGYEVSPVLWRKVRQGLSAGRVQSPATRIVVERERERIEFVSVQYWGISGKFAVSGAGDESLFEAVLHAIDGTRVATGKDFDASGKLAKKDRVVLDEATAAELVAELTPAEFSVRSVVAKPYARRPYPPFRTATLQQEAGRKLRFNAGRAMSAAQKLYEGGYITYMRTDSITLSGGAVNTARSLVSARYGSEYLPAEPRIYSSKVKNAQEAHEAIRPAGDSFRDPEAAAAAFGARSDETRLYDLIWKRTVASQMADARGESLKVVLGAEGTRTGRDGAFTASGKTITFPGFLRAYVEGRDDPDAALDDQERRLPEMAEGDRLGVAGISAKGSETKPPARYTEASLIKRLEDLGIGRPSTYASIITTIQDRGYVFKKGTALVPTFTAFAAVNLLENHFGDLVDYAFTARMEDDLDNIARGDEEAIPWLNGFYFGNGHPGLKALVSTNLEEIDAREINSIYVGEDESGSEIVARSGRYGPYVQRGEERTSLPDDLAPDELSVEVAVELLEAPSTDRTLGDDPESGLTVFAKTGRYGPYVQLGEPEEGSKKRPKTSSLFKSMAIETVSLDEGLELLSLPRVLGPHPDDGVDVTVQNGRYGPYIKWGKETRSLEEEDQLLTIDLDDALRRLAEPKRRGRRATPPLKELGNDPNSGKPVQVKDGRYGPYVTDGDVNASLGRGDSLVDVTLERAAELLQARRDRIAAKGK